MDQRKMDKMRMGLLQSQIDENATQAEARKAEAARKAEGLKFLQGLLTPGAATYAPGQLGSGSFGVVGNADPLAPAARAGGLAGATPEQIALAKKYGHDLTEVYKLARPDMQVSNGYAYDKNKVQPGFLPQMTTANNGMSTVTNIGADGQPVISAPRGALNTYGAYRRADEGTKADFDPVTVTPQGENPQITTRGNLVRNPAVSGGQIPPAVQAARDAERRTILEAEVKKAEASLNEALGRGDQSAAGRAQADLAALRRELGGKSASVGMPLQSDEEKLRGQKGVEADAKRNEDVAAGVQKSKDTLANIRTARSLLQQGPTSSGVGALVDAGASLVGKSFKSGDVAAQLDTLSGWMVNNVPRMEGPQSNFDVQNYKTMAGLVGDRTKPLSQRLAALDTLEGLQAKYSHLNGGGNAVNGGGATGSWGGEQKSVLAELPKTAPKGQKVRDTATGKILQFNGLSWVEVK
jgi:hypothetical protein